MSEWTNIDASPARIARDRERGWDDLLGRDRTYRDRAYVEAEVATLAAQLRALA